MDTPHISVSVIVPVYTGQANAQRCIDSILAQTLKDIEIILVASAKEDESFSQADEYAKKDKRISIIHTQNLVFGTACNAGIKKAKGEYVAFVDANDIIEPKMYEALYGIAKREDVDEVKSLFFMHNKEFVHEDGEPHTPDLLEQTPDLYNCRLSGNDKYLALRSLLHLPSAWSAIFRRETLVKSNVRLPDRDYTQAVEFAFVLDVFCAIDSIYFYRAAFYHRMDDTKDLLLQHNYKYAVRTVDKHARINEKINSGHLDQRVIDLVAERFLMDLRKQLKYSCKDRSQRDELLRSANNLFQNYLPRVMDNEFMSFHDKKLFAKLALRACENPRSLLTRLRSIISFRFTKHQVYIRIFRFPLIFIKKEPNYHTCNICNVAIRRMKKTHDEHGTTVTTLYSYFYCPVMRRIDTPEEIKVYLLGIRIRHEINIQAILTDISSRIPSPADIIFYSGVANAIAAEHSKIFPPFKNSNKGKSIAIFASGPSIRFAPPLVNSKSIACNRTIERFKDKDPDYFFGMDFGLNDIMDKILAVKTNIFLGRHVYKFHRDIIDPTEQLRSQNNIHNFYVASEWGDHIRPDIEYFPLADFGSIVHVALNFALYTSPDIIYLIGVDTTGHGYSDRSIPNQNYLIDRFMEGYNRFSRFRLHQYPKTRIVSVNPVGLRGIFEDVYTREFVEQNPEIDASRVKIIDKV